MCPISEAVCFIMMETMVGWPCTYAPGCDSLKVIHRDLRLCSACSCRLIKSYMVEFTTLKLSSNYVHIGRFCTSRFTSTSNVQCQCRTLSVLHVVRLKGRVWRSGWWMGVYLCHRINFHLFIKPWCLSNTNHTLAALCRYYRLPEFKKIYFLF